MYRYVCKLLASKGYLHICIEPSVYRINRFVVENLVRTYLQQAMTSAEQSLTR